jgi:glyoxylase-like metal-dependent hydrolase (beta-lactamase superfamily II)
MNKILTASIKTSLVSALLLGSVAAQAALKIEPYVASPEGFGVTSILISGDKEAVLVNGLFNKSDALRVAANVLDSGKTLTTIFVSFGDPDFYFGLDELHRLFPNAKIVATANTVKHIQESQALKKAYWSPKMGNNAPTDIVVPEVFEGKTLTVDGEKIELRGEDKLTYLWVPSTKTILGGIPVTSGEHLWTADDATVEQRKALKDVLKQMLSLKPDVVIPAHMVQGAPMNSTAVQFSIDYLNQYDTVVKASKNSAELIEGMKKAYPQLPAESSLELGAKVVKGEMKWP